MQNATCGRNLWRFWMRQSFLFILIGKRLAPDKSWQRLQMSCADHCQKPTTLARPRSCQADVARRCSKHPCQASPNQLAVVPESGKVFAR